jgi:HSP20 family protein
LCIRAERSAHHEQRGDGGFYRSEFRYGQFTRTLALPTGVTAGDVTASYTDGILEVHVPLEEGVEPVNRVEVTRGAESGNGSASGGGGT